MTENYEYDFNVHIPPRAIYGVKYARGALAGYITHRIKKRRNMAVCKEKDELAELFNVAYEQSERLNLTGNMQIEYINDDMISKYKLIHCADLFALVEEKYDFTDYITDKIKAKNVARHMRVKRFHEKANLHIWNFFVTQTYDNAKYASEDDFKKAYLTCLSHLSTDFGWRYMGVFERGKLTGRLHFHGVFYIPNGAMKGYLKPSRYFSPYEHRMKSSVINSFFAERFGRCDFECISKETGVSAVSSYILKYVRKSENKVVYSRGISDKIVVELTSEDIIYGVKKKYADKFVIFDDILQGTFLDARRRFIVS